MNFSLKEIEKLKVKNLKEIIDFLKEINNNLNLSSDFTMKESIERMNSNKPFEDGKKKSSSRSRSKSKEDKNNCLSLKSLIEKESQNQNDSKDWSLIKNSVKESLHDYLFQKTKRNPMLIPIITEI